MAGIPHGVTLLYSHFISPVALRNWLRSTRSYSKRFGVDKRTCCDSEGPSTRQKASKVLLFYIRNNEKFRHLLLFRGSRRINVSLRVHGRKGVHNNGNLQADDGVHLAEADYTAGHITLLGKTRELKLVYCFALGANQVLRTCIQSLLDEIVNTTSCILRSQRQLCRSLRPAYFYAHPAMLARKQIIDIPPRQPKTNEQVLACCELVLS